MREKTLAPVLCCGSTAAGLRPSGQPGCAPSCPCPPGPRFPSRGLPSTPALRAEEAWAPSLASEGPAGLTGGHAGVPPAATWTVKPSPALWVRP